jgi:hypothetical protein
MTVWRTTVTEIILIFRDALRALVPHVTKARIEWHEHAAYDDWDDIADVLFQKIVVASVLWALSEVDRSGIDFAAYDMMYESYAEKGIIVVNVADVERRLVFHSFGTRDEPFDIVRTCIVDGDRRVVGDDFVIVPADGVTYHIEAAAMIISDLIVKV